MSYVLGVTGSIATGKSTVVNVFRKYNFPIVDGDIVAREVVEPGTAGLQAIVDEFGTEVLTPEKQLDRKKLGGIIFHDDVKRQRLNEILNPFIRNKIVADIEKGKAISPLVIADIPLLFEGHYDHYVNASAVVYVPQSVQLKRLMARDGFSKEKAQERIDSQWSIEKKKALADYIFDNQGSFEDTQEQVVAWLKDKGFIQ